MQKLPEDKIKLGIYKHSKKGYLYEVIGLSRHSETLEEYVVYKQLYDTYALWHRPLKMFFENVEIDGKEVPRFEYLGNNLANVANLR